MPKPITLTTLSNFRDRQRVIRQQFALTMSQATRYMTPNERFVFTHGVVPVAALLHEQINAVTALVADLAEANVQERLSPPPS